MAMPTYSAGKMARLEPTMPETATRPPEIEQALGFLEQQVGNMERSVGAVGSRLASLTRDEIEKNQAAEVEAAPSVALARRIHTAAVNLRCHNEYLESILRRLEV